MGALMSAGRTRDPTDRNSGRNRTDTNCARFIYAHLKYSLSKAVGGALLRASSKTFVQISQVCVMPVEKIGKGLTVRALGLAGAALVSKCVN